MINSEKDTLHILSDVALKAYDKVKELIEKIFSLIKNNSQYNDFKEDFYKSYIDFANKLKLEATILSVIVKCPFVRCIIV